MRVGYEPDYVCYNPLDDKVYCTARGVPGHLLVLDAGVDTVITTIQLGREPQRPSHNALNDRLYLVDFGFGRQVVVIDGRGDSIIHTIPLPHDPHFTTFLPFNNRLYVSVGTGGGYKMAIIDCSADTVTAVISEAGGGHPRSIAVYPERAKVYMDGYYGLNIFDAWGDSLLRTYSGVSTQATALCYFPPNIELFMPTSHLGDSIFIVDCTFDTFVDEVRVGNTPSDACLDPLTGKYYCLNYWSGSVTAIDAATHRVLRTLRVGELPNCVELDSCRHRLFVSTAGGSAVAVIQDSLAGIGDWLTGAGRGPGAATVVRGVISLQSPAAGRQSPASLLDACGRKVMELRAGANDVRHLVPGVYFVLAGTGRRPAKVLVCR
jgi:DNA-binding beta-propeller fold protein YncE